jgi:hypothetical protein
MRSIFRKALDQQLRPFWNELNGQPDITLIEVPEPDNRGLEAAYRRLYYTAGMDNWMDARKRAKQTIGETIFKNEEEMIRDAVSIAIDDYLATEVGLTIEAIGNTTKEQIQRILDRLVPEILDSGVGSGAAQTALRDAIKSEWHRARYFRTERIVRTEVSRVSNWGSLKGVQSTEIPHYKVWLSAFAPQSRPEHIDADNQKVDIDEDFDVMGESLQYPGDPAGSAGNTINCLCSMTYETKELTE